MTSVNAYYIYSVGNITYSGSGHSGGTVVESEAQALHQHHDRGLPDRRRAAHCPVRGPRYPEPSPIILCFLTTMTGATSSRLSRAIRPNDAIYFQVDDPSFGAKTVTASFSYQMKTGTNAIPPCRFIQRATSWST
jgi:hypothetical protein